MLDILWKCTIGQLKTASVNYSNDVGITVILANKGYPESFKSGSKIVGLENVKENKDIEIFHSGTSLKDHDIIAAGGRVLSITARANSLKSGREKVYETIKKVKWPEGFFRKDIGLIK